MNDKGCDYCSGFPAHYPDDPCNPIYDDSSESGIFVSMQDDGVPVICIETEDIDYDIAINYCPFCGRRLVDDGKEME